jgi:hypothetical protein
VSTQIKFNGNKHIVIIQTPVSSKSFTQVTCLMSEEEYEAAKLERPDLVFKLATDLDSTPEETGTEPQPPEDETKGITITGLTLPHNLDTLINQLFEKDKV